MKQAFLKTMEALLAVVVSFIFLLVVVPTTEVQPRQAGHDILLSFEPDIRFRACVLAYNESCVDAYLQQQIPGIFEYKFLLTRDNNEIIELPDKEVIQESLFIAGDETHYQPTIVRLFYWTRE